MADEKTKLIIDVTQDKVFIDVEEFDLLVGWDDEDDGFYYSDFVNAGRLEIWIPKDTWVEVRARKDGHKAALTKLMNPSSPLQLTLESDEVISA